MRSTALAECAIYDARKIPTPLHLGLAAQLHHEHGKRGIINTLHAHGFTVHYDELRRFETAMAQDPVTRMDSGVYIPSGLIPRGRGGCLIQEGDDNIDINAETIDGKDTFHAMARVIFQRQMPTQESPEAAHVSRGRDRSMSVSADAALITKCRPFQKPDQLPEPPRREGAMQKVNSVLRKTTYARDISWVLLRLVPQKILPLLAAPPTDKQTVPFWTGFNAQLSKAEESHSCYPDRHEDRLHNHV